LGARSGGSEAIAEMIAQRAPHEPRAPRSLGISGFLGHDGNAALVADGRSCSPRRRSAHTRKKHDGRYPENAIEMRSLHRHPPTRSATWSSRSTCRPGSSIAAPRLGAQPALRRAPPRALEYLAPARRRFRAPAAGRATSHVAGAATSDCASAAFLCVDGKEDYSTTIGVVDERR
jgi:predicted NodU family carbamoyl transferase